MKKLIFSSALLLSFGMMSFGQNGMVFEYKISSNKGPSGNMKTYYASAGTRVEMKMNTPRMGEFSHTSIVKSAAPTMVYILNEQNKTYIGTELPQGTADANGEENRSIKITGKEKIDNYNCTHVLITEGTETREYWTTTEIADYEKYSKPTAGNKFMGSSNDRNLLAKNGAAGFIVKMINKNSNSGNETTMELEKLEKKDLDANLFEVPADYKASAITAPSNQSGVQGN